MKVKPSILLAGVLGVTSMLYACTSSNPNRPSMTFGAPLLQQPANGVIYNFNQQPLTLTITNSVRTGSDPVTYSVQVATDSAFTNKVFSRDGIAEGANGTTSVTIDMLAGNQNYYWRWNANVGGVAGAPSSSQSFFVKPNIVLNAPQLLTPASGATVNAVRPTFTVIDSTFTGQPAAISYEFQVSTSSSFQSLVASATVAQTSGQTSWTPSVDMPVATLYWRARARDLTNNVDSGFASASQFDRKAGLDLNSVVYQLGPNIANWPETRQITATFDSSIGQLCIFWTGEDWPAIPFPFDETATIEGNQWNFVQINGTWYGGASSWYRPNQNCKTEGGDTYFSDSFMGIQPISSAHLNPGDQFAVAISTPARTWPDPQTLNHRSNVIFVTW